MIFVCFWFYFYKVYGIDVVVCDEVLVWILKICLKIFGGFFLVGFFCSFIDLK